MKADDGVHVAEQRRPDHVHVLGGGGAATLGTIACTRPGSGVAAVSSVTGPSATAGVVGRPPRGALPAPGGGWGWGAGTQHPPQHLGRQLGPFRWWRVT